MKVLIAGATGVLGRRLIKQFQSRGHSVIGLTRDARGDQVCVRWAESLDKQIYLTSAR